MSNSPYQLPQDIPAIAPKQPTNNIDQNHPISEVVTGSPDRGNVNLDNDVSANTVPPRSDDVLPDPDRTKLSGPPTGILTSTKLNELAKPETKPEKGAGAGEKLKSQENAINKLQSKFTAAKSSRVWDIYAQKTTEGDKELVEDWDRVIDVTLVFAALFSAISTGFVLESSKNLQPDQSKATVLAIRDLTRVVRVSINASPGVSLASIPTLESPGDLSQPTMTTVWVNCLWFSSLGLSISVSLFAMLAKRWCYEFRSKRVGTSYERAMKRQASWDAIEQWKMQVVVDQLPTLMHIALILFFIGLVVYLSEINQIAMIVMAVLVGLTLAVYCVLTVLRIWFPACPMGTPFTQIILSGLWYSTRSESSKNVRTRIQSFFQVAGQYHAPSRLSAICTPGMRLPDWQPLYQAIISVTQWKFHIDMKLVGQAILRVLQTIWATIMSSKLKFFAAVQSLIQMVWHPVNSCDNMDWIMQGCEDQTGKTKPRLPLEDDPNAFRALSWLLSNASDKETIKEVLNHVTSFPEVILDSYASSEQLYAVAAMAAGHLNRFQHDAAEWRDTIQFNPLYARLVYLAARPWLHRHRPTRDTDSTCLTKTQELYDVYFKDVNMTADELKAQLVAVEEQEFTKSTSSVIWVETMAKTIVLCCLPVDGLSICTALGKSILIKESSQAHDLKAEIYPTLWWIFLNNVMDCTYSSWPFDWNKILSYRGNEVTSDATLTFSHFRDSRTRQKKSHWLTIVGISGMLYTFAYYPNHQGGPTNTSNKEYFAKLIAILRSTLCTVVMGPNDPFVGELPVYLKTEVRLYEFDSLHYGFDALRCALGSPSYRESALSDDLSNLVDDFSRLKDMRQLIRPQGNEIPNYGLVAQNYNTSIRGNFFQFPNTWLAMGSGLLCDTSYSLSRERTQFLSGFLPDIIFGIPTPSQPSRNREGRVETIPTLDLQGYAETCNSIATWAWMPFQFDLSELLLDALKKHNSNHMPRNALWEMLRNTELLQIPLDTEDRTLQFQNDNYDQLSHAFGYCLYIKASLLERLYSFSGADNHSPDIVEWSIALSKHVIELLKYWDQAEMDADSQAHIITSLMQLINTLLDPSGRPTTLEASTFGQDPAVTRTTYENTTAAQDQLKGLVDSGILRILSYPFSDAFKLPAASSSERISDLAAWRDDLARTIDGLARIFPPPDLDPLEERNFYDTMVAYYENRVAETGDTSQMLVFVQRLRDYMKEYHLA